MPRTFLLWILVSAIALIIAGCSSSDRQDDRGFHSLSRDERDRIVSPIIDLQSKVRFSVLAPAYLPEGLDWVPTTQAEGERHGVAIISFVTPLNEDEREKAVGPIPLNLSVVEVPDPNGNDCPPCPGRDPVEVRQLDINGATAAERVDFEDGGGSHTLWVRSSDLNTELTLVWQLPYGEAELTPGLRDELIRVAKSITPIESLAD